MERVSHIDRAMARYLGSVRLALSGARRKRDDAACRRLVNMLRESLAAYDRRDYTHIPALYMFGTPHWQVEVTRANVDAILRWARWTVSMSKHW
jgi:hypothetical protein